MKILFVFNAKMVIMSVGFSRYLFLYKIQWIEKIGYKMLLVVKFRIRGNLRFLSHAETLRLFQRACRRAEIRLKYSSGFNPRPKLSLPFPRSVGVESDNELLVVRLSLEQNELIDENCISGVKTSLSAQLPEGCRLLSVKAEHRKTMLQPQMVIYRLKVPKRYLNGKMRARIENLRASESLNLQRKIDSKEAKYKMVNVRPFLKSIWLEDAGSDFACICVECSVWIPTTYSYS